jgi:hypothetical protein
MDDVVTDGGPEGVRVVYQHHRSNRLGHDEQAHGRWPPTDPWRSFALPRDTKHRASRERANDCGPPRIM